MRTKYELRLTERQSEFQHLRFLSALYSLDLVVGLSFFFFSICKIVLCLTNSRFSCDVTVREFIKGINVRHDLCVRTRFYFRFRRSRSIYCKMVLLVILDYE